MNVEELDARLDYLDAEADKLKVPQWAEAIRHWVGRLNNGDEWTPSGWYLTDLRHLSNLTSPNSYVPDDAYLTDPERFDELHEFALYVEYFIEDVLGPEDGLWG